MVREEDYTDEFREWLAKFEGMFGIQAAGKLKAKLYSLGCAGPGIKGGMPGCWMSGQRSTGAGYPRIIARGRSGLLHRYSLQAEGVLLPPGIHVHHRCGNKQCFRPAHLEALPASSHMRLTQAQSKGKRRYTRGLPLVGGLPENLYTDEFQEWLKRFEEKYGPWRTLALRARVQSLKQRGEKTGLLSCWVTDHAPTLTGYVMMRVGAKTSPLHRISVELSGRSLAPGAHVHHECGTPRCFRPSHLTVLDAIDHISLTHTEAWGTRRLFGRTGVVELCQRGHPKRRGLPCDECQRVRELNQRWYKRRRRL